MAILLGLDTGGTYTDAVLFDESAGVIARSKALTTKYDLSIGLGEAVAGVLSDEHSEIGLVSLSTTLATNALVEGHGSPVCLVLIGFEPSALDRAGLRAALGSDPVVFIRGGHGALGEEQAPLDRDAIRSAAKDHGSKVAAFAVAAHFGVRNPAHEIAAREILRLETGLPVTCAHDLTSNLDAPRRALTSLLNARLIPLLQQLILAVHGLLKQRGIGAPLMVVMGDGTLMSSEAALERPIETILSGPAASVVGARFLSGERDVIVVDMGGTTSDIALLRDGRPILNRNGAVVGGWRTMVEAVDVRTVGLGGDSEVRSDSGGDLVVGPRRVVPLSLLAEHHPECLDELQAQSESEELDQLFGRFLLRQRKLDTDSRSLTRQEARLWEMLEHGPVSLKRLESQHILERPIERMVNRGLLIPAGFTPSDAAHCLNRQSVWSKSGAEAGARIWAKRLGYGNNLTAVAERVFKQVVRQAGAAIVDAALQRDGEQPLSTEQRLARSLVDKAMGRADIEPLINVSLRLNMPLVAIGAPAATYYPEVAERLGTRLTLPECGDVCNAVGAVASGVSRSIRALITMPSDGVYRVHLPSGLRDFNNLEDAAHHAAETARGLALTACVEAGAANPQLSLSRYDKKAQGKAGHEIFIESVIEARAHGRPRLAE